MGGHRDRSATEKGRGLALARDRSPRGSSIPISTSFEMTCGVFFFDYYYLWILYYFDYLGNFEWGQIGAFHSQIKVGSPREPAYDFMIIINILFLFP